MTTENSNGHHPEEEPSLNGHQPDGEIGVEESQESGYRGPRRFGMEEALGLDRNSGLGYGFNPILEMARGSTKAEEWRVRTEVSEREITVNAMRSGRRHRARYGWTNTELLDWNKAHDRISLGRKGRKEIERMYIAERNRPSTPDKENSGFERMGGNQPETMRMK